jgi:maleylacetate reductase
VRFTYEALPGRVVFGVGSVRDVADELGRLGVHHAFLIADAQAKTTADDVVAALGTTVAQRWDEVAQHVPV